MFWTQVSSTFLEMFLGVASATPITIPFITLLWLISMLEENRKLPTTQADFMVVKSDLKEYAIMNVAVFVIFMAQIVLVSIINGLTQA